MKKMKRFKKAAVMLMAAVMCFGVAGCKKTTGGETPTGDVYAPSFSEISSDVEYVTNVLAGDGRLSIMGQVYDRETYALTEAHHTGYRYRSTDEQGAGRGWG